MKPPPALHVEVMAPAGQQAVDAPQSLPHKGSLAVQPAAGAATRCLSLPTQLPPPATGQRVGTAALHGTPSMPHSPLLLTVHLRLK